MGKPGKTGIIVKEIKMFIECSVVYEEFDSSGVKLSKEVIRLSKLPNRYVKEIFDRFPDYNLILEFQRRDGRSYRYSRNANDGTL